VRALVAAITCLLIAAPAAGAQDAVDRAAQALKQDPVYVDPEAENALDGDDTAALRSRIADSGLELHVAVLPESAGNPATVAETLAEQTGLPGDYAVVAGGVLRTGPSDEARAAADEAVEAHTGEGAAVVLLDFVDRLDEKRNGGGGIPTGTLILLGLGAAGGVGLLAARRRRQREQAAEFAEVKDNVRDDLVALGDDIRALEVDMDMPGAPDEAKADYETAVNAYGRADQTWRLAQRPDDLEPVGAALEEGRWAMQCARARLEGHEPPERRAPCFFDPRHGPSARDVEWAPPGGEPRMVPVCEADAQRVERGEDPEAREVTVGGQRMPYWAAGPMYAPFMGGFYGAGLLPGLLIGTSLGGMWDQPSGDFGGGDWGGGDFGGGDFGGGDF